MTNGAWRKQTRQCKNGHPLSERLESLGMMGAQLRVPSEPHRCHSAVMFSGCLNWASMTPRDANLLGSYTCVIAVVFPSLRSKEMDLEFLANLTEHDLHYHNLSEFPLVLESTKRRTNKRGIINAIMDFDNLIYFTV